MKIEDKTLYKAIKKVLSNEGRELIDKAVKDYFASPSSSKGKDWEKGLCPICYSNNCLKHNIERITSELSEDKEKDCICGNCGYITDYGVCDENCGKCFNFSEDSLQDKQGEPKQLCCNGKCNVTGRHIGDCPLNPYKEPQEDKCETKTDTGETEDKCHYETESGGWFLRPWCKHSMVEVTSKADVQEKDCYKNCNVGGTTAVPHTHSLDSTINKILEEFDERYVPNEFYKPFTKGLRSWLETKLRELK